MTRRELQRVDDILEAILAIREHVGRGELSDGLIFDAVCMRLVQIGEATKSLPASLLDEEPGVPWGEIAKMRDRLAHRYFDTLFSIVAATVTEDLAVLEVAARRLREVVEGS